MDPWCSEVDADFSSIRQFQTCVSSRTVLGLEETPDEEETGLVGAAEISRNLTGRSKRQGEAKSENPNQLCRRCT